jgi:hypothetical protein
MLKQLGVLLVVLPLATGAVVAERERIEKAADLPRFSYKIDGKLED